MRTEVKIGIAVGVIVAIVAVLYVVFHEPAQAPPQAAEANAVSPRRVPVVPRSDLEGEPIVPSFGGAGSPTPAAGISEVMPGVERPAGSLSLVPAASQPGGSLPSVRATGPLAIKPTPAGGTLAAAAGVPIAPRPMLPPAAGTTTYVVQEGDMGFWAVAEKVYGKGKGKYWTVIEKANPNVDSNRLGAGTVLKIPPLPGMAAAPSPAGVTPTAPAPPAGERVYIVQGNDSWWEISKKHYGDGKYYEALQKANPQVTGMLQPGQKIVIPALGSLPKAGGAVSAPTTRPAAPAESDRPVFE